MELKNKRVLVVGLGKSGISAAMFLRGLGARVTVSDTRSAIALAEQIPALLDAGVMVESGGHGLLTFRRQDLIVVSPGVPLDTPEVKQVIGYGLPVIGELELATRFLKGQIVAVTGSNGKTTTTSLIGKIFADAGRATQVGGNIGLPVIELIAGSTDETMNVLEVSSFQLETTEDFHPKTAVILNITPDHLDRHHSFEKYVDAKEKIFANQTAEDALILNADDPTTQMCAGKAKSRVYWFSATKIVRQGAFLRDGVVCWVEKEGGKSKPILPVAEIHLKGTHNVENVLAAVCAARLAGTPAEQIRKAVAGFKAVEHRLEYVRTVKGVEYFNDSKATNVDAAMKAVESFAGCVHLILGGKDKDSDYTQMHQLLGERVKTVYTVGSAAEKIERQLLGVVKIVSAGTLATAVAKASAGALAGDVVLLAPACSSFDQFDNYEHRGRVFRQLVMDLPG
ncbi:UDP-N-acetylmuramoylalanine--D-glutamate ligase [Granulicella aggregans]|uniref:UDP-N-acetylmuramoylalanine--D-glutamate ligase n=1 Tax=Granulicella aggregans TaxID=474949 RepID=A0A7W8E215_9BACT|nr:UDP-N-acetylmuramoyl-L-alanine--D-glutamate ligase [Granulicella aggregans]MBB5056027.1 UDP-N-acetylmuramoylalanine--D-glutamate ligase [Granulicella aggregans]